jgi:urease accessory protein
VLKLLHLCDSLFPLGGFAYSDGLERAAASGLVAGRAGLAAWLDVTLDETIGRLDGPGAWQAWDHIQKERWDRLRALDEELIALRPSSAGRRATRAMGRRLLTTWRGLYANPRLDRLQDRVERGELAPTLPVAFAAACTAAEINRHDTVTAFAYTRLASTVSAAMRLAPIGQIEAHALLARVLARTPDIVARIAGATPEAFSPALDIAAMSQQYLHSRLFRS